MMSESMIKVEIDTAIGAAYLQLSNKPVRRTEEFSEDVNVDLDEHGMVVGIELLDTSVPIPLDDLTTRYHVNAATLALLLASLQPESSAAVARSSVSGSSPTQRPSSSYRTIEPRTVATA